MSALVAWLLGLIPKAVETVVGKPGEKLEAPLGQSKADAEREKIEDERRDRRNGVRR